jgi:hypothetical protein
MISTEILIEQNSEWDKVRSAAKKVLLELGAPFSEWEQQQLEHPNS